jgi:DNA-directed RNA polymerase subunit L
LDSQKYYKKNSFDFVVQSIGVYENLEIIKYACIILQHKFIDLIQFIDSDTVMIIQSSTTIENCYDFILENEDYTMGKVIEYILYENYFVREKRLSYCGFKKMHPHDSDSIIRVAFFEPVDKTIVRQLVRAVCVEAQDIYKTIYNKFDGK